jgi:hypothetical protein
MYIQYFNKTQLPESLFVYRRSFMAQIRKLLLAIKHLMVTVFCWRFVLSTWNGKYYSSYRLGNLCMTDKKKRQGLVTYLIRDKLGTM